MTSQAIDPDRATDWSIVTDAEDLRAIVGAPLARTANKARSSLHPIDRAWLAASPFVVLATSGADGTCDVSPRGDPAGFVKVLDDRTVALPERPGNRRADSLLNILSNPHVGLIAVVPGRGDTLRLNGRATIVRDASFLDGMVVRGHRPPVAIVVHVDEVFYHCSKAFLRSALWDPASWDPDRLPRRAVIAKALERQDEDLGALDEYYGPSYAKKLY